MFHNIFHHHPSLQLRTKLWRTQLKLNRRVTTVGWGPSGSHHVCLCVWSQSSPTVRSKD
jgi:hypothetical protein